MQLQFLIKHLVSIFIEKNVSILNPFPIWNNPRLKYTRDFWRNTSMQYPSILLQMGSSRCKAACTFICLNDERIFHARISASIHAARLFVGVGIPLAQQPRAVSTKLSNSLSRARLHFSSGKKVPAKRMNVCNTP